MAFTDISSLALGNYLQICFSAGVRDNLSQNHREFELVQMTKEDESVPRQWRFLVQVGRGPAAIQYRSPGSTSETFPTAQRNRINEGTAVFKELDATVEIEYSLWDRARHSPEKYAEPLAMEIAAKQVSLKRRKAIDFYGDGTGVVATVSAAVDNKPDSTNIGTVTVTIRHNDSDRGFVGWCEYDDLLVAYQTAGNTARAPTETSGSSFHSWRVSAVTRNGISSSSITIIPVDSSGTLVGDITASNLVAGDIFYRVGQSTKPQFSAITDYNSASECEVGLESLLASDGRTLHGLTMSGAFAASDVDAGGVTVDTSHLQSIMNLIKNRVGADRYNWNKVLSSWEGITVFIESKEADRRFTTVEDNVRGGKKFVYQHLNSTLEFVPSEFCPFKRMYILPEAKGGEKVLAGRMTDFAPVSVNGSDQFNLVPGGSGTYLRLVATYLMGHSAMVNHHPAACGRLHNILV